MTEFVRFRADDGETFAALQAVFSAIKYVKNLDYSDDAGADARDHDLEKLRELMPARVQDNFDWPEGDSLGIRSTERVLDAGVDSRSRQPLLGEGRGAVGVGRELLDDVLELRSGLPVQRSELDHAMRGPVGQQAEDVAQVRPWLDVVEPTAREQ